MSFEIMFEDLDEIESKDGEPVRVIRIRYPYLLCWFREYYWAGNEIRYKALCEAICGLRHINEFKVSNLKKAWGLWAELSQEQQLELESRGVIEEKESRPGRKPKTEPVEIVEPVEPVEPVELVEPVEIQKARTRKPADPRNAGIPKKLHCHVCNRNLGTSPDQFRKQVEKSGKSQEEFCNSYHCRSCRKEKVTV